MGRFFLVILIWIGCVGSVALYMNRRDAVAQTGPARAHIEQAAGVFSIEVTPTFTAQPDPFALQTGDAAAAALTVRLGERELLRVEDEIEAGRPIRVDGVEGMTEGANEIFVSASPPLDQTGRNHAVRIRVLRDGLPVGEATFWSESGSNVAGSYLFELHGEEENHGH